MKKKVIHVTLRADYGGAPNYINTMINNMSDEFDVYLACPTDEPYYNIWKNNNRVKDIFILPHRKFSLKSFFGLIKFVKNHKIDVFQANGKGAGSYRFIKLFIPKLKILYAYRGFHIQKYTSFQRKTYFLYERIMTFFTDKVINVSKGEQSQCIDSGVLKKSQSEQIYNGIEPLKKSPNEDLSRKFDKKFVVTTLSRFDIQKNMDLMYNIAKELREYKDICFIWIGDGDDKLKLEKKAEVEDLKNIEFVGFKNHDEIAEYFTVSDLYLTTARWEGLPFALVEASSFGLPIVASDVVGNNEVCLNNVNGFLYPITDVQKAVESILTIYNDKSLQKKFREGSLELFLRYFTVEQMVNSHEKLYNQVLLDGV